MFQLKLKDRLVILSRMKYGNDRIWEKYKTIDGMIEPKVGFTEISNITVTYEKINNVYRFEHQPTKSSFNMEYINDPTITILDDTKDMLIYMRLVSLRLKMFEIMKLIDIEYPEVVMYDLHSYRESYNFL